MINDYLEIGKIVNTHGVTGEVKVYPLCDDPDMLCELNELYIDIGKTGTKSSVSIMHAKVHKNMVLMKLEGITDLTSAEKLKDVMLYARRDDFELEENTYFIVDLIGLNVIDADDNNISYGTIVDVTQTGANDVYHIKNGDGNIVLIPAIAHVVIKTDIQNGIMEIRPLKGLFE